MQLLKPGLQYFLKQMISKYFPLASVLVMTLFFLSSCLNSSTDNVEYSPDAQIYSFSLSSKTDTTDLLSATKFTIDQINGRIFNDEPLPYLFHVDSVALEISGSNLYNPFSQVTLTLDEDSTYLWQASDSVAINRLSLITTTAPDGISKKEYRFELNIYQEDPYILTWQEMANDYLPAPFISQHSVLLNGRLITYLQTNNGIEAVMAETGENLVWNTLNLVGLPSTINLTTLTTTNNGVIGLDSLTNTLYHSSDGIIWNSLFPDLNVQAIYGTLPTIEGDKILLAIAQGEKLHFAVTTDFTDVVVMNNLPENFPLSDFSVTQVNDPASYSIKHLLLAGGIPANSSHSNLLWMLQQKEDQISWIFSRVPESLVLRGSTLFYYDSKPYLMTATAEGNSLYHSNNHGLDWVKTGENQSLPEEFTTRTNASVSTDAENYIWIFGGISLQESQIADVWRGRLNKFSGM